MLFDDRFYEQEPLSPGVLFVRANSEVERVLIGYKTPEQELYDRYLRKSKEEKEAFVLALIGQTLMYRKRLNSKLFGHLSN
jgi:hypothetical protein